jgi:hypothetical protein
MIKPLLRRADNTYVNGGDCSPAVSRKDARPPERVRHAGNQDVTWSQVRAAESRGGRAREETIGSVFPLSISDVRQLNEPHIAFRILVLAFNPVAVYEDPRLTKQLRDR